MDYNINYFKKLFCEMVRTIKYYYLARSLGNHRVNINTNNNIQNNKQSYQTGLILLFFVFKGRIQLLKL